MLIGSLLWLVNYSSLFLSFALLFKIEFWSECEVLIVNFNACSNGIQIGGQEHLLYWVKPSVNFRTFKKLIQVDMHFKTCEFLYHFGGRNYVIEMCFLFCFVWSSAIWSQEKNYVRCWLVWSSRGRRWGNYVLMKCFP